MTTALKGVRCQRHALSALYPRERPGTHCTGRWVGSRAGLDGCEKPRAPPGFDPRTFLPIACRYTDWATGPISSAISKPLLSWNIFSKTLFSGCILSKYLIDCEQLKCNTNVRIISTTAFVFIARILPRNSSDNNLEMNNLIISNEQYYSAVIS
jgi:hypothetical protein